MKFVLIPTEVDTREKWHDIGAGKTGHRQPGDTPESLVASVVLNADMRLGSPFPRWYGPFADDAAVETWVKANLSATVRGNPVLVFDAQLHVVPAGPKERPDHLKRAPDMKNYRLKDEKKGPEGGYVCKDCGAEILAATIAHPIWDGPGPCSGGGECQYEKAPYCPLCDVKPGFHGSPIIPR